MRKLIQITLYCFVLILFTTFTTWAIPIVSVAPVNQNVLVGDILNVDVVISDVSNLSAWSFDLKYNSSLIAYMSTTEGPFLSNFGIFSTIMSSDTPTANSVRALNIIFDFAAPGASVSGSGVLASLSFSATNSGVSHLTLTDVVLSNPSAYAIPFTLANGSVNVTPIPEPGTMHILGFSLICLAFFRRKFKIKN